MTNPSKTVTLPSTGAVVLLLLSATFFYCSDATAGRFEVSFDDGQSFVQTRKGVQLGSPGVKFNSIALRTLPGSNAANTVTFFYSDSPIADMRGIDADQAIQSVYAQLVNSDGLIVNPVRNEFIIVPLWAGTASSGNKFPNSVQRGPIPMFNDVLQEQKLRSIEWLLTAQTSNPAFFAKVIGAASTVIRRAVNNVPDQILAPDFSDGEFEFYSNVNTDITAGFTGEVYATYWI